MEHYIAITLLHLPEIIAILAAYFIIKRIVFLKNSEKTFGEVTKIEAREVNLPALGGGTNRKIVYMPKIKYSDTSGTNYILVVGSSARFLSLAVGEQITVIYSSKDPRKAFINKIYFIWIIPFIFLTIGMVSLLLKYK
jgi:hypothetical protein